jgi:hypothetical protein
MAGPLRLEVRTIDMDWAVTRSKENKLFEPSLIKNNGVDEHFDLSINPWGHS